MSIYEKHRLADGRLPFILHDYRIPTGGTGCYSNWHENIEILYFMEGDAIVTANERHLGVTAGDIAVINANSVHSIVARGAIRYLVLIVDRAFCLANHFDPAAVSFTPLVRDAELSSLLLTLFAEYADENAPYRVPLVRARVLTFLSLLLGRYVEVAEAPMGDTPLLASVKRAIGYLHAEYATPLTLDRLAAVAGISKYYLAREFRRLTGMTVVTYLNHFRCEKAKPLLAARTMSVEAVALAVGFSGASYFNRIFRRTVGVSPSEYRKSVRDAT